MSSWKSWRSRRLVGALVLLAGCRAQRPAPPENAALPVQWEAGLQLPSLDVLDAALSEEDAGAFVELTRAGATARPRSCSERTRLREAGYATATVLDQQADAAAFVRCAALAALKTAVPAKTSAVRNLDWKSDAVLAALPAEIITAFSLAAPESRSAVAGGASLREVDARTRFVRAEGALHLFALGDEDMMFSLRELAVGDFNGDGHDDVLVAVHNGAGSATTFLERVLLLTRQAPGNVLRLVRAVAQ